MNSEEEDLRLSVQRYLNSDSAGKWLLIDNADDEDILFGIGGHKGVKDYLPESENGLTLFTTRHKEMATSLADTDVVEIQEMSHTESVIFLGKWLIRKELLDDMTVATEMLNELAYLSLAIAQAVAYINTMKQSIQDYLCLLRNTEQDTINLLSRKFHENTRYKNSQNSIATTWLVSFDQIRKLDSFAADLLCFMSPFGNKAIPRSMLPFPGSEEKMAHAIRILGAYAFITEQGDSNMYDLHRLVHLATKIWVTEHGDAVKLKEEAVERLEEILPSPDYQYQALWNKYLPHVIQFPRNTERWHNVSRHRLSLCGGVFLYGLSLQ